MVRESTESTSDSEKNEEGMGNNEILAQARKDMSHFVEWGERVFESSLNPDELNQYQTQLADSITDTLIKTNGDQEVFQNLDNLMLSMIHTNRNHKELIQRLVYVQTAQNLSENYIEISNERTHPLQQIEIPFREKMDELYKKISFSQDDQDWDQLASVAKNALLTTGGDPRIILTHLYSVFEKLFETLPERSIYIHNKYHNVHRQILRELAQVCHEEYAKRGIK